MLDAQDPLRLEPLLEALLDSWDRNNTILLNLLRALPEGGPKGGGAALAPRRKRGGDPGTSGRTKKRGLSRPAVGLTRSSTLRNEDNITHDELNESRQTSENVPLSPSYPVVYIRTASGLTAISGLCCSCRIRMIWPAFGACNNVHGRCSSVMRPRLPI